MSVKMIICNGRTVYKNQSSPPNYKHGPTMEFTLMVEHIIRFGKLNDNKFHTWLICRDMFEGDVCELWLEETPEQIRSMITPRCWIQNIGPK